MPKNSSLAALPSVDDLLRSETAVSLIGAIGQKRLADYARAAVTELRTELRTDDAGSAKTKDELLADAESRLSELWQRSRSANLRRVINATGVVVHTNLGRAPLSDAAKLALADMAGYCSVEYDLTTGDRGNRGENVERMLCALTGAEDALVVNNCAAAAYLLLTAFAIGREVIISRGELVEIGGEFRIPDVLSRAGVSLKEVGTTNRTKLADYKTSISDKTAMILKVHPSNYRIVGFTTAPNLKELAELAHRSDILLCEDAGSGALVDLSGLGLEEEPVIRQSIEAGADVVLFSGDKLLGGPQAGIIVGNRICIEKLRRDPLYRALRVSKLIYAALQATLESYLKGAAQTEIPVFRMLAADAPSLERRARVLTKKVENPNLEVDLVPGHSAVGGGAAPLTRPESPLITLKRIKMSATDLEAKLRRSPVPVIARIVNDRVALDLRTVSESEDVELIEALSVL
jgi:L-seryl-tRNA(Ser) seleniumtransferase